MRRSLRKQPWGKCLNNFCPSWLNCNLIFSLWKTYFVVFIWVFLVEIFMGFNKFARKAIFLQSILLSLSLVVFVCVYSIRVLNCSTRFEKIEKWLIIIVIIMVDIIEMYIYWIFKNNNRYSRSVLKINLMGCAHVCEERSGGVIEHFFELQI